MTETTCNFPKTIELHGKILKKESLYFPIFKINGIENETLRFPL